MHEQVKAAFDPIHADAQLKGRTRDAVLRQMHATPHQTRMVFRTLAAAACMVILLAGGHWLYFTPTAEISIDINPSLELSINRFDRVIGAEGRNEDGAQLLESVQVRFSDYQDAIAQILESGPVAALLAEDADLTITVVGPENAQCARMLIQIESCTAGQKNACCYHANASEVSDAHALGLSYGKYSAYLALQALDPSVTPEEVQEMTMREIRERIESLGGTAETAGEEVPHQQGYGHHGHH